MGKNLSNKLGKGLTPQRFIDGMTKNKEKFQEWYDRFQWENEEDKEFFESLNNRDDLRCLILMADWCGDVVRNVPVVFRALEISGIPTEVLIKEQHPDVMAQFLTGGGEAIPIVIFTDFSGLVLGHWGPRPAHVQAVMTKFKQENPDREAADYNDKIQVARQEMARQYGEGTEYQTVIVKELRDLLSSF
ncbi:thioredoxin family protein [Paenibacillus xerothermodurans]|uniref:Thioredoxin family protein n=1 Tax=Paenibacillus xerothermodurans TaxID=1977292 RepID=A0A2W1NCC0_PAEXE|nr:thioredoxin family protein [Paenibacillus xerothermodurans]PZE20701.1 thioredoxin family protein [Paenibacillus xerothermodurans]